MKIATFGCSWTQGVPTIDKSYCWPKAIANANPNWQVDNWALAGSSLSFQAYLLDDVCKNNSNSYDKIIFQITSPNRLTYFDDALNYGTYLKQYNNYREFDRSGDIYRNFIVITPGHMKLPKHDSFWNYSDKHNFASLYYKYLNTSVQRTEYKAVIEYVKNKVDLIYFHNEDVCKIGNVPILMDIVGDKFVADEGDHFNKQGSQWIADWVLERI